MRVNRLPYLTKNDSQAETYQVFVPSSVRYSVFKLSYDGYDVHLGVRKTYCKIMSQFYWPEIKKDVLSKWLINLSRK